MIQHLGNLPQWFGPIGLLAIAAWLLAALGGLAYLLILRRRTVAMAVLLLALVGWALSLINSYQVRQIQPDYSAQEAAEAQMRLEAHEAQRKALLDKAADIRFAEDDQLDRLDLAGVQSKQAESVYEQAIAEDQPHYSFRDRGKQQRSEGMTREGGASDIIAQEQQAKEQEQANVRKLLPEQLAYADRADELNLAAARMMLWLAVLLLVLDYLRRFSQPLASVLPLPLGGQWLAWLGRPGRVIVVQKAQADFAPWYRRQVVGKGQTLIDFGPDASNQPLYRWSLGQVGFSEMPRMAVNGDCSPRELQDALESAWFGRAVVSVDDASQCLAMMSLCCDWLDRREHARARTRRGLHLIWRFDRMLDADLVERLVWLCRQTGVTLLLIGHAGVPGADQVFNTLAAPRPTVVQRILTSILAPILRHRQAPVGEATPA